MSLEIPVTIVKTAVVAALKLITGVTKTNTADKTMAAAGTPLFEIVPNHCRIRLVAGISVASW